MKRYVPVVMIAIAALAYAGTPNRIADKPERPDARAALCDPAVEWIPMDGGVSPDELLPYVIATGDPQMPGPGSDGSSGCGPVSCHLTCVGGNTCTGGPCTPPRFYASCSCLPAGGCIGACVPCPK